MPQDTTKVLLELSSMATSAAVGGLSIKTRTKKVKDKNTKLGNSLLNKHGPERILSQHDTFINNTFLDCKHNQQPNEKTQRNIPNCLLF